MVRQMNSQVSNPARGPIVKSENGFLSMRVPTRLEGGLDDERPVSNASA
jgi:hypothetical protein